MSHRKAGELIKALRIQSGLSQDELSQSTLLSLRTIQRIENGETEPRGDSLKRIASALNISVEDLTVKNTSEITKSTLKEDKAILIFMHLSAFGYLIYPLLGVIFPMLLWLFFKDKVIGADKTGRKVIKRQVIWCTVVVLFYTYILVTKLNHSESFVIPKQAVIVLSICLYVLNAIIISFHLIKLTSIKRLAGTFQDIFKLQ